MVEFFGVPGSGKSTITRCLAHGLLPDFYVFYQPTSSWLRSVEFRIKKVFFLVAATLYLKRNYTYLKFFRDNLPSIKVKNFLNFLIIVGIIRIASRVHRSVILDQGIFQVAWSLCQGSLTNEGQKHFIRALVDLVRSEIDAPRILILSLEVSVSEITQRLVSRGGNECCYDELLSNTDELSRRVEADGILFKEILRDSAQDHIEVPQEPALSCLASAIKAKGRGCA